MSTRNICNICGGNLINKNGRWVCEACNAYLPEEITNEEITLLYNANQKMRLNSFDDAYESFLDIAKKYPSNSDAYWGLACAEYGIKYEQDYDGKMIPTCYNTSYESLYENQNYQKAIALADQAQRGYYEAQAELIERVRKEWIEKASLAPKYDIFLSFKDTDLGTNGSKSEDGQYAFELYNQLTSKGYKVFFSKVSLKEYAGQQYEPYIFNALNTSKVMVVYGSKPEYFASTWVKNEWTRYYKRLQNSEKNKSSLLIVYKNLNPNDLPRPLNKLQCYDRNDITFFSDLIAQIERIISAESVVLPQIKKQQIVAVEGPKKVDIRTIEKKALVPNKIVEPKVETVKVATREIEKYSIPTLTRKAEGILNIADTYLKNSDFDSAFENYLQILVNSPQNGQALLGKLLATNNATSLESFLSNKIPAFSDYELLREVIEHSGEDVANKVLNAFALSCLNYVHQKQFVLANKIYRQIEDYDVESIRVLHKDLLQALLNGLIEIDNDGFELLDEVLIRNSNNRELYLKSLRKIVKTFIADGDFDTANYYFEIYKKVAINDYDYYLLSLCIKYKQLTFAEVLSLLVNSNKLNVLENILSNVDINSANKILGDCVTDYRICMDSEMYEEAHRWLTFILSYDFKNRDELITEAFSSCIEKPSSDITPIFDLLLNTFDNNQKDSYLEKIEIFANSALYYSQFDLANSYYAKYLQYNTSNTSLLQNKWCAEIGCSDYVAFKNQIYRTSDFGMFERILLVEKEQDKEVDTITQYSNYCISYVSSTKHINSDIFNVFEKIIGYYQENANNVLIKQLISMADICKDKELYDYAQRYYAMVCGIDQTIHSIYWGLLQSKLHCKDNKRLITQNKLISECPEFNNAITAASNDKRALDEYITCKKLQEEWVTKYNKRKKVFTKTKKIAFLASIILGTLITIVLLSVFVFAPLSSYNKAKDFFAKGNYMAAAEYYKKAGNFEDAVAYEALSRANNRLEIGDYESAIDYVHKSGGTVYITYDGNGGTPTKTNSIIEPVAYINTKAQRTGYKFVGWKINDFSFSVENKKAVLNLALSSKWEVEKYRIYYDYVGEITNKKDFPTQYTIEGIAIPNPTRIGYDFIGWIENDTELPKDYVINKGQTGDRHLEAKWVAKQYIVSFSEPGVRNTVVTYDSQYTLPTPQKAGYVFNSWLYNRKTINSSFWDIADDVTLTASWTPINYSIDYVLNGGHLSSQRRDSFNVTTAAFTLNNPTRIGYTFIGWSGTLLNEITKNVLVDTTIPQDRTYSANWQANNYTISFNVNGGNSTIDPLQVTFDAEYTLPTPIKDGYDFAGWYYNNAIVNSTKWNVAQDVTLTARWTIKSYSIIYNLNGGSLSIQNSSSFNVETAAFTLNNPTRIGYTFAGWSGTLLNENTKSVLVDTTIPQDRTYSANWQANIYTVSFNVNGGNSTIVPMQVTYDANYTLPTPIRDGYDFAGWYYNDAIVNSTKWNVAQDVTLTAHWSPKLNKIIFNANGGSGTMQNQAAYSDSQVSLSANTFIPPIGHHFVGWDNDAAGTVVCYEDQANYTMGLVDSYLYAVWEPNIYTITYDANNGVVESDSCNVVYGTEYALVVPTRAGYTFDGWYVGEEQITGVDGSSLDNYLITGNITATAKWHANLNVVTLVNNGNNTVLNGYTDSYIALPKNTQVKDGYLFEGWAETNNGEVLYKDADLYKVSYWPSSTLYGIWNDYDGYIKISTVEQLKAIKNDLSGKYCLVNDIDLYGETWEGLRSFSGEIDGRGFSIYNIEYIVNSSSNYDDYKMTGFYDNYYYYYYTGFIKNNSGMVKNINFYNISFNISNFRSAYHTTSNVLTTYRYDYYLGGVAAKNTGTINNCKVSYKQDININENVYCYWGTICGYNEGSISNCVSYTDVSILGTVNVNSYTFNMVGHSEGLYLFFGGICGGNNTYSLKSCVCVSNIEIGLSGGLDVRIGGIIGTGSQGADSKTYYCGNIEAIAVLASGKRSYHETEDEGSILIRMNCIKYIVDSDVYFQFFEQHEAKNAIRIENVKDGYSIVGWSLSLNGEKMFDVDGIIQISGDNNSMVVYAVYVKNPLTLSFDANGCSGEMDSITVYVDEKVELPLCLYSANPGYHFAGWSNSANGDVIYEDAGEYVSSGLPETLYAIWMPNTNTIVFNSNGGSGSMDAQQIETGETQDLNKCTFDAPQGYYFAGWATSPAGSVVYYDCDSFTSGTASVYNLYAIWEEI